MALRLDRAARLRRAARGRAGFVALACALYLGGGVSATWPAVQDFGSRFLAGGAPGHGEAAPGDHLQTGYRLWLAGHQLGHGRKPWRDPYTFQPEVRPTPNFGSWPFGLPYWPLAAALGPVLAWNVFTLLTYLAAGGFACAWLRELGLARGAALAGGVVFAIAPYRVGQSAGHLLGPISIMLPLALWAFERGRHGSLSWLAVSAGALVSIPLSGQVHLALGAIPFFLLYAFVRSGKTGVLVGAAVGALAAVGAGLLVQKTAIAGSITSSGRSLADVRHYSANWLDFVARDKRHGTESFVFVGWLAPVLAALGLATLISTRRRGLALALAIGFLVPCLLALGTNLPLYTALWHALPPLRYPRVPERLMPIACLALGALAGVAVGRARGWVAPLLVVLVLFLDLHVRVYGASVPDGGNRAYAALRAQKEGRLLELPVFTPDSHYGSVYLYYDMQVRRERPTGYSTLAPRPAGGLVGRLQRLNCGDWSGGTEALLHRLGVRFVAFHVGLFRRNSDVPDVSWFAWRALVRHGFRPLAQDGVVTMFVPGRASSPPPSPPPSRDGAVFCQGWHGRAMNHRHAPFWVYGVGPLELRVASDAPLRASFSVDEGGTRERLISSDATVRLPLRGSGWHLVTVDVPTLPRVRGKVTGMRVLSIRS
jgi:hypothetical protein